MIGRGDSDQVDCERLIGALLHFCDLSAEHFGGGVAAGEAAERSGVGNRGDQFRFGNPGHRTADDRIFDAEKFAAAFQQRPDICILFHN